jgi:conjugative relaxase-like TrwC/TraI family protein
MLTIRTCKGFSHALGEYLRQADYYSEGLKVEGICHGRLCAEVGLVEGEAITDQAFSRVASNRHAGTGAKLTARMKDGRRAGYDAVFNAPKSVSIQAFLGGDERLIRAHERAVSEALDVLGPHVCYQDGQGLNKRHLPGQGIAAAVFRHGESRALDPHLHSHAFVFNVTQTDSGRLLALESSGLFERTKYLTEVYRNALAREVQSLGYGIERRDHGFELVGVAPELLSRFSKRAQERDRAIAAKEADLGRDLTSGEIAVLVRESRAKKQLELSPDEVRQSQLAQVSEQELAHLRALRPAGPRQGVSRTVTPREAVQQAIDEIFERRTVVRIEDLTAEVLRQAYGQYSLRDLEEAIRHHGGLIHAGGQVSTVAALELERSLVARLNAGVGFCEPLGHAVGDLLEQSFGQRAAIRKILASTDQVTVFRGKAGTGKTHALATAIEGVVGSGAKVACFAPTTQAVDILRQDGIEQTRAGRRAAGEALSQAMTVQRLLADPQAQEAVTGKLLVVDEYGLMSTRQLKNLVDVAELRQARLLLVGDSSQHKSVEAGDGARIVEKETRVTVAELAEIRRQATNPAYREAAQALAAGRIREGLSRLDRMGAVVEVENPTKRRACMVEEWHAAIRQTKINRKGKVARAESKTTIMVAATWVEIDALNAHAREKLRNCGQLTGDDQPFTSLRARDWTKAQHKNPRNYQTGDVLVVHQATKHFNRGDELCVVRKEKRRLIVARGGEEFSVSPRQSGLTWTVCEERPLLVAAGDRMRLRAVGQVRLSDGQTRRLANGATVVVQSVDAAGRLVLADGSTLLSRQAVHGYAMTSHAAQGLTVDQVFVAGAISREGLYVSATRGREAVRIFVPDREAFLEAAGLRSEERMSALEFERQRAVSTEVTAVMARGWRRLRQVHAAVAALPLPPPPEVGVPPVEDAPKVAAAVRPVRPPQAGDDDDDSRRRVRRQSRQSQRISIRP